MNIIMDENEINKNYILAILNKEKELSFEEGLKIIEIYCLEQHKNKQQIDLFLNAIRNVHINCLQYYLEKCLEYYKCKFNICWVTKINKDFSNFNFLFCDNQTILFYF